MWKNKKLGFLFMLFTLILCFSYTYATEDEDFEKFLHSNTSSSTIFPLLSQTEAPERSNLTIYFEDINRVQTPKPWHQVLGGMGASLALLPSLQILVPFSIMGLLIIGVTKEVIPNTWLYTALMAVPPTIIGGVAGYNALIGLFNSLPKDVVEVHKEVTKFDHSYFKFGIYTATQSFELLFWGGLFTAIIMNMESRLNSDWGNPRIWGAIFSICALPLIYYIFIHASNNADRKLIPSWKKNSQKKKKELFLQNIRYAQAEVRHHGISDRTKPLGVALNIIESSL